MHICTLNYDLCYTLHPDIKFTVNLNEKYVLRDLIASILNLLKTKDKLHFTILYYILDYILHPKL